MAMLQSFQHRTYTPGPDSEGGGGGGGSWGSQDPTASTAQL